MMTSSYRDAWRSKWQIIGITPTQLLADDSGRWLVDSQKSPETTRKEILTVGSPFHTNSLLLLTHTYKHSLRLRLPVPLPVGKSTSGWRQIGKKSTSGGGLKMKTIPLATVLLLYLGCHLFSLRKFLLRWLSSRGLAYGFTLANVLSGEHQPNPTFLLVSRKTHDFIFKIHGLHADSDPEKIQKISENFLIWAGVEIRKKSEKKKFWTLEAHSTCPYSKWSHAIHIIYDSILWVIWIGDSLLMTQNLS